MNHGGTEGTELHGEISRRVLGEVLYGLTFLFFSVKLRALRVSVVIFILHTTSIVNSLKRSFGILFPIPGRSCVLMRFSNRVSLAAGSGRFPSGGAQADACASLRADNADA
jgi:hypothetical protein